MTFAWNAAAAAGGNVANALREYSRRRTEYAEEPNGNQLGVGIINHVMINKQRSICWRRERERANSK